MACEGESFPLHESVFINDLRKLSSLIRSCDLARKDKHGNTALHLAVMLGHKECVQLLLARGAPVKVKNAHGWTPLAEGVSYGDRQTVALLLKKLKQQSREQLEERRPVLLKALNQIGDFYLQLKWDFTSWVPLVSRILPSDVCKIYKKGSRIRLDTTLVDFNDMRWERGDISVVYNGEAKPNRSLVILDNKLKVYQRVRSEDNETEIDDEVDLLMGSDIVAAQMSTKAIQFHRAQSGFFFRADRSELVGAYQAEFYHLNGLTLESRKRREHLSQDDLKKNKALMESFTRGSSYNLAVNGEVIRRPSLCPPAKADITWEEYINGPSNNTPFLGRQIVCKEVSKTFKAMVAMSQDFPLSVETLLDVLEVIAPVKHFSKLREFVQLKLPPGFPVKIDIPILPTVTTRVTFQDFEKRSDISDALFEIPSDYYEDPGRFPEL